MWAMNPPGSCRRICRLGRGMLWHESDHFRPLDPCWIVFPHLSHCSMYGWPTWMLHAPWWPIYFDKDSSCWLGAWLCHQWRWSSMCCWQLIHCSIELVPLGVQLDASTQALNYRRLPLSIPNWLDRQFSCRPLHLYAALLNWQLSKRVWIRTKEKNWLEDCVKTRYRRS